MTSIHNIAVAGHGTCGKTTFLEELLFLAKSTTRAGSVEAQNSILDHDEEERHRGYTIDATPCYLEKDGKRLTFIDTPGYPDFLGNAIDALQAVETVLIAVDAAAGVRVNTRRIFREAGKLGLARAFLITRMDADNADFDGVVEQIRGAFGNQCLPLFLPNASGVEFASVENTYFLAAEPTARAREVRQQLVESVIESDEALMERYLAEEEIAPAEIDRAFTQAMRGGSLMPILCCSAERKIGLQKTLDTLVALAPAHDQGPPRPLFDREDKEVAADTVGSASEPLVARVFKVELDPFVGKLSFVRVLRGHLEHNGPVYNATRDHKDRVATILRMQGKDSKSLPRAEPGDIVAIPKVDSLHIGDTLTQGERVHLRAIAHPVPMVKLAVEPKSRNDETKIAEAFHKLVEGDPCFRVERVPATRELVIAGRSTLHLDVVMSRLRRRFHLEVNSHVPKTSYKESISGRAESHYRHKKQTGGRGQFGDVYLRLAPTADKTVGLEFVDKVVGGVIPNNFIPAVEKGIREIMEHGILAGFPVVGCHVELYDGSFHAVDSSEQAFKTAGREAFKQGFLDARPVLLEPILNIEVHIPTPLMGDITSDLNGRRARISGMDTEGDTAQVIRATVPEAEVKNYSTELRSMTGGEGSYTLEFSHYEVVPAHVQEQVIKEMKATAS